MKEFWHYVIGDLSSAMFAALYFFAIIGVIVNLLVHSNKRNQASKHTPHKFSLRFLIWDNKTRLLMNILVLFVTVRFLPGLMNFDASNQEFYLGGSFFVGFAIDKVLEMWKGSKYGSFLNEKRENNTDTSVNIEVSEKG